MGVKGLWTILKPILERKPISELSGQIVAVDLAPWIVELQRGSPIASKSRTPSSRKNEFMKRDTSKVYLSNMYFRTWDMLRSNLTPIFITDGRIPELKKIYLQKKYRNVPDEKNPLTKRGYLDEYLKECRKMFELMGLCTFKADNEAEDLCSALNCNGIVNGVITEDSDVFLRGARNVYRNFAITDSVRTLDYYSMNLVESSLKLSRVKLIATALITGRNDYFSGGIKGKGTTKALKMLNEMNDEDVLNMFANWPNNQNGNTNSRIEDIIQEYLRIPEMPTNFQTDKTYRREPNVEDLKDFLREKFPWTEERIMKNLIRLYTNWLLQTKIKTNKENFTLLKIVKRRIERKVPVYECHWSKFDCDEWTKEEYYVTLERRTFIDDVYPDMSEDFNKLTNEPKNKRS